MHCGCQDQGLTFCKFGSRLYLPKESEATTLRSSRIDAVHFTLGTKSHQDLPVLSRRNLSPAYIARALWPRCYIPPSAGTRFEQDAGAIPRIRSDRAKHSARLGTGLFCTVVCRSHHMTPLARAEKLQKRKDVTRINTSLSLWSFLFVFPVSHSTRLEI